MTLEQLKVIITAETSGLKKAIKSVQGQLKSLSGMVGKVTGSISSSFKNLSKSINNSFKGLAKMVGLTAAIAGLVKLGKAAVQAASDLEEVQNVVNVVFGNSAAEIDAWAKSCLTNFGLVEVEAKDMASTFKAMANGMGIADKSGKTMSMRLTELAADLASFRNTTADVAATALAGVFTGETEALKKFGVVMTQANLEAYALSQGITKSYTAMSQAEKVALRYNYVLQATADAQGDFARSSGSWANQIRVLKGQWSSFLGVLGTAITQVFAPLLQALNKVLAAVITITKAAFAALGVDFSVQAAKVSGGIDAVGGAADDATDSVGGIGESLGGATQQAKELYHELASFDELNLLGDKSKGGSGGGGSGGGGSGGGGGGGSGIEIEDAEVKLEKTEESAIGNLEDLLKKLNDWFENTMGPWLQEKAKWLGTKINELVDSVPWDLLGYTAANGLNQIIAALDTLFVTIEGYDLGAALSTFVNSFVDKFDAATFGKMIGDKIKLGLDIAIGFLETFDASRFGEKLADMFSNLDIIGIAQRLGESISLAVQKALTIVTTFIQNTDGQEIGAAIATFFNNLDIPTLAGTIGNTLSEAIKYALDIAIGFFNTLDTKDLQEAWDNFWANIDFEGIKEKFGELKIAISDNIKGAFGQDALDAINNFVKALEAVVAALLIIKGISLAGTLFDAAVYSGLIATMTSKDGIAGLLEEISLRWGYFVGTLMLPPGLTDALVAPFQTFHNFLNSTILPGVSTAMISLGNFFAHPIASIQGFASAAGTAFSSLWTSVSTFVVGIPGMLSGAIGSIGTFFTGLAGTVSSTIGSIVSYVSANGILGTALNGLKGLVALVQGGIKAFFAVLAAHPFAVLVAAIAAVVASFTYLWNTCDTFKQFFVDIWNNTLKPMFDDIAAKWKELVEQHIKPMWEGSLKPTIEAIWNVLKEVWDKIAHLIGTVIMVITPVVTGVVGILSGLLDSVIEIFGDVMDVISGILDFITGVFTGDWEKAWNGVVKVFKGIWDGIVDVVKAPINLVIGLINGMIGAIVSGLNAIIRKINGLSFTVPDWVPGIGGSHFGFSLPILSAPQIPFLANGGVIEDPTLAMLGEYPGAKEDPEIATPQSLMKQTMIEANGDMVNALYQMAQQIITAIEGLDMNVSIGDDTIAASAKRGADDYKRRTGKPMFA